MRSPEQRYIQIERALKDVVVREHRSSYDIDRILLHPVWGMLCLSLIVIGLFSSLFAMGKPMADFLEDGIASLGRMVMPWFSEFPFLGSLLLEGVFGGVGTLLAFVPLIGLLFFMLGLLEESGYLARITFLLDRILLKSGLSGRAFVPLMSGYACAIPAILSTRVIRNPESRLMAILLIPFLSCSARLPLYTLVIANFFSPVVGSLVLVGLYLLGAVAAFFSGCLLKRYLFKNRFEELILELPRYRVPRLRPILRVVYQRLIDFVGQAGTLILGMSIGMWALFHFPLGTDMEHSWAATLGHWIEPWIKPIGFDWKLGLALLAAFSAREVMVSTLGVIYGVHSDWTQNYTPLQATSLLIFFALAFQCFSTLAIVRQETGSWKWPLFQFVGMTGIAWTLSFLVFQGGMLLGFE
ncbi:MAG: ferrous iron transport protein B [Myxococcaceae bacterium]|nr:ferrous iron transport protein B [Myxococcaceae bacterium]MBH2005890.1 ferrous iron transport protein B [Myxococcaceae bacterium]